MFKFDLTDQRRLAVATAITVIALPSLWLMSRDDDAGAPNVASAGVVIAPEQSSPGAAPRDVSDPMGSPGAAYLDGAPVATTPDVVAIAIPGTSPGTTVRGTASYSSRLASVDVCEVKDAPFGVEVTVTNLDNSRSVTCRAMVSAAGNFETVVMHTHAFATIADLADVPVPVEIHW